MEKGYRIRIIRDDVEFEVEGDKKFVVEMLDRFESGATLKKPETGGRGQAKRLHDQGKSTSVREFIQKLGVKKHVDVGLAFGYYLERVRGNTSFIPADINNCYYEAKMETSNTSQLIIQNIRNGRMMEAKKAKDDKSRRKAYVLTHTGEQFILGKLESTK